MTPNPDRIAQLERELARLQNSLNTIHPHPELGAVSFPAWMDSLHDRYGNQLCNHVEEFVIQYVKERDTLRAEVARYRECQHVLLDERQAAWDQRDTLQAQLAVVVQVLEQIRDLELDRPMTWEGPTAQWQHQQLATAQVMAAKTLNNHPAAARELLGEVETLKRKVDEYEKR